MFFSTPRRLFCPSPLTKNSYTMKVFFLLALFLSLVFLSSVGKHYLNSFDDGAVI